MYGYSKYQRYDRLVERLIETSSEKVRKLIEEKIEDHPTYRKCKVHECEVCAMRDCPYKEPLHYHRDGCPVCHWNLYTDEQLEMEVEVKK